MSIPKSEKLYIYFNVEKNWFYCFEITAVET